MAVQVRQVEYVKEIDDVAVLLIGIVHDAKAGKSAVEIATGSLQNFLNAVAGVDQVGAEASENRKVAMQTIGYRVGELADALLAPKSVQV
jgi:hypothetical protein